MTQIHHVVHPSLRHHLVTRGALVMQGQILAAAVHLIPHRTKAYPNTITTHTAITLINSHHQASKQKTRELSAALNIDVGILHARRVGRS
jgi:hypothetical protein